MDCLWLNSSASVPYLGSCGSQGCAKAQGSYQWGQELQALGGELRAWSRDTLHPKPRKASTRSGKPDTGGVTRRAGRDRSLSGPLRLMTSLLQPPCLPQARPPRGDEGLGTG